VGATGPTGKVVGGTVAGDLTIQGKVTATGSGTFENARVGAWSQDASYAQFGHKDQNGADFAIIQKGGGDTHLNAMQNGAVHISTGNDSYIDVIDGKISGVKTLNLELGMSSAFHVKIMEKNGQSYQFKSADEAEAYCKSKGMDGLCTKAQVTHISDVNHANYCNSGYVKGGDAGWHVPEGLVKSGCGSSTGWISWKGDSGSNAWCCKGLGAAGP